MDKPKKKNKKKGQQVNFSNSIHKVLKQVSIYESRKVRAVVKLMALKSRVIIRTVCNRWVDNTRLLHNTKKVHPTMSMSKEAMAVLNDMVSQAFSQVCEEAGKLCKMERQATLQSRDVASAVKLVFPGIRSVYISGRCSETVE